MSLFPEIPAPVESPKPRFTYTRRPGGRANETWEGTYEYGVTREEIAAKLRGPFGGSFESFGGGNFVYVAYMD
jgi:hypothetical protein